MGFKDQFKEGFNRGLKGEIPSDQINQRLTEICDSCGDAKVKAINAIREEFDLSLIVAKKLVDEYYKNRIDSNYDVGAYKSYSQIVDCEDVLAIKLSVISDYNGRQPESPMTMYQNPNGEVYFDDDDDKFIIISYSWNGPQFNTISRSESIGNTAGKTKRKGRILGAVVGTALLPGIGTVIGAAHGTGNKKSKGTSNSRTVTYDSQTEVNTLASIKLKNTKTGQIVSITISCNSYIDSQVNRFSFADELNNKIENIESVQNKKGDPYGELKQLKELLDMGIITQDEFNAKKKQLLGI